MVKIMPQGMNQKIFLAGNNSIPTRVGLLLVFIWTRRILGVFGSDLCTGKGVGLEQGQRESRTKRPGELVLGFNTVTPLNWTQILSALVAFDNHSHVFSHRH